MAESNHARASRLHCPSYRCTGTLDGRKDAADDGSPPKPRFLSVRKVELQPQSDAPAGRTPWAYSRSAKSTVVAIAHPASGGRISSFHPAPKLSMVWQRTVRLRLSLGKLSEWVHVQLGHCVRLSQRRVAREVRDVKRAHIGLGAGRRDFGALIARGKAFSRARRSFQGPQDDRVPQPANRARGRPRREEQTRGERGKKPGSNSPAAFGEHAVRGRTSSLKGGQLRMGITIAGLATSQDSQRQGVSTPPRCGGVPASTVTCCAVHEVAPRPSFRRLRSVECSG